MATENNEMNMMRGMPKGYSEMIGQVTQDLEKSAFQEPEDMMMIEIVSDIAHILMYEGTDGFVEGMEEIKELITKNKLPSDASWYPKLLQKISDLETISKIPPKIGPN